MRRVPALVPVLDHFPIYANDGFSKVPDLGPEAFVVVVYRDGEVADVTVQVSPIAQSPGEYRLAFTPMLPGFYEVEVAYAAGQQVYTESYEVVAPIVEGSNRPPGGMA